MADEQSQTPWQRVRNFIAGYCSGICLVLVGHPFDTIKVRLQTEGTSGKFKGPIHCLKETFANEGIKGVYKGMSAPLVLTGGINAIMFGIQFNIASEFASRRLGPGYTQAQIKQKVATEDHVKAAFFSGFLISFIVTPIEGVKARLQVQYKTGEGSYKGPIDCAKRVYQELGLTKGIYRGWLPVAFSRMSNYSYFGSYAYISATVRSQFNIPKGEKLPFLASLFAGGMAGFMYWLSCYPMDVIKNRMMTAPDTLPPRYSGTWHAAKTIYTKEGLRAFFAGFTPCAMRAFPANGAAFVGFEVALRIMPEQ